ncbi:acylphosphatase [uncultured Sphingomonas sp.]|uniref:acylphosphatase n=1 Tax=uncultured Sphingomonas sp. TaxID=158754 RepID=UPI0035C9D49D
MSVMQRLLVSGRIHQVGYRNWTVKTAQALGVTGWIRNRNDGRIEILACGEPDAVTALIDACRQGPPQARVDHVEAVPEEGRPVKGFTKRFTA